MHDSGRYLAEAKLWQRQTLGGDKKPGGNKKDRRDTQKQGAQAVGCLTYVLPVVISTFRQLHVLYLYHK